MIKFSKSLCPKVCKMDTIIAFNSMLVSNKFFTGYSAQTLSSGFIVLVVFVVFAVSKFSSRKGKKRPILF